VKKKKKKKSLEKRQAAAAAGSNGQWWQREIRMCSGCGLGFRVICVLIGPKIGPKATRQFLKF